MYRHEAINQAVEEKQKKCKDLHLDKIANKAGISLSTFNVLKAGKHIPKVDTLERIAHALDVDMNYFFDNEGWESEEKAETEEETGESREELYKKLYEQQIEITRLEKELAEHKNVMSQEPNSQIK